MAFLLASDPDALAGYDVLWRIQKAAWPTIWLGVVVLIAVMLGWTAMN